MGFDRPALKRSVRQAMKVTRPHPMLVTLLFSVAVSVVTGLLNRILGFLLVGNAGDFSTMLTNFIGQGYEVEEAVRKTLLLFLSQGPGAIFAAVVGGGALSVIVTLWQDAMGVGYSGWCLSMARRENPPLEKLFCALPQIGPVLLTRLLTGVFELLWTLLLGVGFCVVIFVAACAALAIESEAILILLALAATAAFGVGVSLVTLRYALVNYVLLDKGLFGLDAIRESKRLMKGRTKDAFFLQLSFIGWYLLEGAIILAALIVGVVAFGGPFLIDYINAEMFAASVLAFLGVMVAAAIAVAILNLWLSPYINGSMAAFYDWARGDADGLSGGRRFDRGAGSGGWGGPSDYTWTSGPTSGTGTGAGPGHDGGGSGPKPPRDDPWN